MPIIPRKVKYSVVIPTYNHLEDCLKPCVESLLKSTIMDDVELIIVANGCTDGTREYVKTLPDTCRVLWSDKPLGYTKSSNVGIKASNGEYVILLNNDTVLLDWQSPNTWIKMMQEPFDEDPKMGVTGPLVGDETYGGKKFMVFFCVMIKKALFDELGLLNEEYSPGGGEDCEFCFKAQDAGYKICQVPERINYNEYASQFPIYHMGEQTVFGLDGWEDIFERNTKILEKKYGKRLPPLQTQKLFTLKSSLQDRIAAIQTSDLESLRNVELLAKDILPQMGLYKDDNYANLYPEFLHKYCGVGLQMWQNPMQLARMLCFLSYCNVGSSLEIGTGAGGTFIATTEYLKRFNDKLKSYACDNTVFSKNLESYVKTINTQTDFREVDSNSSEFIGLINENDIDFAFVDGDNTHKGVMADFTNLKGKVNVIAFHDIVDPSCQEIQNFWHSIKEIYAKDFMFFEFKDQYDMPTAYMGIGLAVKKEFYDKIKDSLPSWTNSHLCDMKYIKGIDSLKIKERKLKVTAEVCTRDRYYSTLPICLTAIALQNLTPAELIIYDDGEQKDLRDEPIYKHIFQLLTTKNIDWKVVFGSRQGQMHGHQMALEKSTHDWIWRCFKGDQKVETIDGMKKIRDIQIGELVRTHTGSFHKVSKTYKNHYKQRNNLIWIKTKNSTIKCTPEHPFFINDNGVNKWVEAKDITTKHRLLYPNQAKKDVLDFDCHGRGAKNDKSKYRAGTFFNNEYFGHIDIDKDMARFFGLYLAEGCGGHDSIRFTFNNTEIEYIDFITRICKDVFGRNPTIYSRWATCVKLNIKSFSKKFTHWFGNKADNKKIPEFVFGWSLKNRLSFLRGYFEGDGWNNSKMIKFSTASERLCSDVKILAISCGLDCSKIYVKKACIGEIDGKKVHSKGSYGFSISSQANGKMYDLLESEYIGEYLAIPVVGTQCKKMPEVKKYDQYVYNLEVETDNSYIVGPAIVHNCDDDEVPEPDCLEKLVDSINDDVGAVAGLVRDTTQQPAMNPISLNKMEDIFDTPNMQWHLHKDESIKEAEHLYSSFLYNKKYANSYPLELSKVGHREETIFSHSILRNGKKLLVNPTATTWHWRFPSGGIRSEDDVKLWQHDEDIFAKKMEEWDIKRISKRKYVVLQNGMGDNWAFKILVDDLKKKYADYKIIIATPYPDVFYDVEGIQTVTVDSVGPLLGDLEPYSIYRFMALRDWKKSMVEAYREMYSI